MVGETLQVYGQPVTEEELGDIRLDEMMTLVEGDKDGLYEEVVISGDLDWDEDDFPDGVLAVFPVVAPDGSITMELEVNLADDEFGSEAEYLRAVVEIARRGIGWELEAFTDAVIEEEMSFMAETSLPSAALVFTGDPALGGQVRLCYPAGFPPGESFAQLLAASQTGLLAAATE